MTQSLRRPWQSETKSGIDPMITREMVVPAYHLTVSPPAYSLQAPNARGMVPAKSKIVVMNPPIMAARFACRE